MIRQQHDAVGVEPLCFQGVDAPHHLSPLRQVDHCDRSVAHPFQIEQAILNEQIALIRRLSLLTLVVQEGQQFSRRQRRTGEQQDKGQGNESKGFHGKPHWIDH